MVLVPVISPHVMVRLLRRPVVSAPEGSLGGQHAHSIAAVGQLPSVDGQVMVDGGVGGHHNGVARDFLPICGFYAVALGGPGLGAFVDATSMADERLGQAVDVKAGVEVGVAREDQSLTNAANLQGEIQRVDAPEQGLYFDP